MFDYIFFIKCSSPPRNNALSLFSFKITYIYRDHTYKEIFSTVKPLNIRGHFIDLFIHIFAKLRTHDTDDCSLP